MGANITMSTFRAVALIISLALYGVSLVVPAIIMDVHPDGNENSGVSLKGYEAFLNTFAFLYFPGALANLTFGMGVVLLAIGKSNWALSSAIVSFALCSYVGVALSPTELQIGYLLWTASALVLVVAAGIDVAEQRTRAKSLT